MKTKLLLGVLGAVIIVGGGAWILKKKGVVDNGGSYNKQIACTEEAKLCSDGSAVGRTGPNCEFTPCPILPTPTPAPISIPPTTIIPIKKIAPGYVAGHVDIGPFCPVERVGVPCAVPPEAYTSREVVIYKSDGYTEKERASLDKGGNYKITLSPGKYFAQIQPAGIGPGEKKPFTVLSSQTITVDFNIDTGIR